MKLIIAGLVALSVWLMAVCRAEPGELSIINSDEEIFYTPIPADFHCRVHGKIEDYQILDFYDLDGTKHSYCIPCIGDFVSRNIEELKEEIK